MISIQRQGRKVMTTCHCKQANQQEHHLSGQCREADTVTCHLVSPPCVGGHTDAETLHCMWVLSSLLHCALCVTGHGSLSQTKPNNADIKQ